MTSGQLMSFCNICQKMKSDIDVTDITNRNFRIDGKSLLGLMSIKLGLPMRLVVTGEDEELPGINLSDWSVCHSHSSANCLHRTTGSLSTPVAAVAG